MKIADRLHRLRINFDVTENLRRFVYIYLIEDGENVHLVDTGVDGAEALIADYLGEIGRSPQDIGNILLTHSHPDHMGAAAALKRLAPHSLILAPAAESGWIEDIEEQFRQRPIPNFHRLTGNSVSIDRRLAPGDVVEAGPGLAIRAIDAKGHSHGSLAYLWVEAGVLFTGDAIPVAGDIPIFVSVTDSIHTLEAIRGLRGVSCLLPAWDECIPAERVTEAVDSAKEHLAQLAGAIRTVCRRHPNASDDERFRLVCDGLNLQALSGNPLFRRSVQAALSEEQSPA